jgi:hypothetical protein
MYDSSKFHSHLVPFSPLVVRDSTFRPVDECKYLVRIGISIVFQNRYLKMYFCLKLDLEITNIEKRHSILKVLLPIGSTSFFLLKALVEVETEYLSNFLSVPSHMHGKGQTIIYRIRQAFHVRP